MISRYIAQITIDDNDIDIPKVGSPGSATVNDILAYVFALMAAIAVIVIIIAGIQFVLSQGNPEKAGKARNTIIYAGVGLALATGSFAIVRLVLGEI